MIIIFLLIFISFHFLKAEEIYLTRSYLDVLKKVSKSEYEKTNGKEIPFSNSIIQKTSCYTEPCTWRNMAVYGSEFLSAGSGTLLSHFALYSFNNTKQWTNGPEPWLSASGYALLTTASTSSAIFLMGELLNQKGNLQKAVIGAGMASIFVSFIEYNYHRFGIEYCLLPPYGAIIGYNWDRDKFFRQAGIYSFEFMGGCVGWGLALLPTSLYYAMSYEYIGPMDLIPLYTSTNMLFTSTTTTIVGKLYKQKGSWLRSALGAGIGAVLSLTAFNYFESRSRASNGYYSPPRIVGIAITLLPPTGALIGYNLQ
ncbi:MAG: hypothetical protein ACUVQ3_09760 [bacterium]